MPSGHGEEPSHRRQPDRRTRRRRGPRTRRGPGRPAANDTVSNDRKLHTREHKVALVGDGVNAAPAITWQGSYSPWTSARIIRQNLWPSLGIVAILVPATITGPSVSGLPS